MNDYNNIPPDQLPFHYDREERLKSAPDNVKNKVYSPRKKFQVDRRLLIIMIDIVIVVIAFFGITAYQNSKSRIGNFEGLKMELTAVEYDGEVLAGLKILNIEGGEPGRIIEAVFYIEDGKEKRISDLVPPGSGSTRILRENLDPVPGGGILKVKAIIGGNQVLLEKKVTPE